MSTQEGNSADEIDFGSRSEWIRLYRERATAVKGLIELNYALTAALEGTFLNLRDNAVRQALGILGTQPPASQEDFLTAFGKHLDDKAARAQAAAANIDESLISPSVEYLELQNAHIANTHRYKAVLTQIHTKELVVGRQYRSRGTPPQYIARALGSDYPPFLEEHWPRVRGSIEVFRFVTRESRPEITLGPAPKKPWGSDTVDHLVSDVQRIQTLQIALAPDPMNMAQAFGRLNTLTAIGEPPVPTEENLTFEGGTWLQAALEHIRLSEPPAQGLLIDRY